MRFGRKLTHYVGADVLRACAKIAGRWGDFVVRDMSAKRGSVGGCASRGLMKRGAGRYLVRWWLPPSF